MQHDLFSVSDLILLWSTLSHWLRRRKKRKTKSNLNISMPTFIPVVSVIWMVISNFFPSERVFPFSLLIWYDTMEDKEHLSSWLGNKSLLAGLFSQSTLSHDDVPGAFIELVSCNSVTLEVMVHQILIISISSLQSLYVCQIDYGELAHTWNFYFHPALTEPWCYDVPLI